MSRGESNFSSFLPLDTVRNALHQAHRYGHMMVICPSERFEPKILQKLTLPQHTTEHSTWTKRHTTDRKTHETSTSSFYVRRQDTTFWWNEPTNDMKNLTSLFCFPFIIKSPFGYHHRSEGGGIVLLGQCSKCPKYSKCFPPRISCLITNHLISPTKNNLHSHNMYSHVSRLSRAFTCLICPFLLEIYLEIN